HGRHQPIELGLQPLAVLGERLLPEIAAADEVGLAALYLAPEGADIIEERLRRPFLLQPLRLLLHAPPAVFDQGLLAFADHAVDRLLSGGLGRLHFAVALRGDLLDLLAELEDA